MYSVEQAAAMVASRVTRLGTETVALRDAPGRVVAHDIFAAKPLPGFVNSAMDGYAARSKDLPASLPIHASIAAGSALPATPIPQRVAVQIMTGAAVPRALDTVVIQERATIDATGRVTLPASAPGDNIRQIGEDLSVDDLAVAAGTQLGSRQIGLLAALGIARIEVIARPRVALIATGDELVDIATPSSHGQLVDSSSYMLTALLEEIGAIPTYLGIVKDDAPAMAVALSRAFATDTDDEKQRSYDVVITTGGVSVGDRDCVRSALATAGVTIELYKVAMKPGKPFSFGMKDHTPVFGLPGNPVSAFVAFELFVRPALLAMQGARFTARTRAPVVLVAGYRKQPGRAHYLRASVVRHGEQLVARIHPKQGSAMLSSLVDCNALVEISAQASEIAPNAVVPAILLEAV